MREKNSISDKHSKLDRRSVFVEKHLKLDRSKGNREIHGQEYALVW